MMRIENRRSKLETVVTKAEWQLMIDQQTSNMFKVIDKDETTFRNRINIPREIEEFKIARVERIVPTVNVSEQEMKEAELLMEKQLAQPRKTFKERLSEEQAKQTKQ